MRKAPHPPYSPDLAPSNFYLFGHVKQLLAGHESPDRGALLYAAQNILSGIEKVTLDRGFLAWMERLQRYVTIIGEYVE
jgi:histone-lysine N-methyltransferase SETMAR